MKTKVCWVIGVVLLTGTVWAQDVGEVPDTNPAFYALTGATIIVGNGQTIQNGTVVIRDGLIESVGSGSPPDGAWVMDLSGMYIYPGLIDALGQIGGAAPAAGRGGRGGGGPGRGGAGGVQSEEGPGYFAHISAADLIESDPEEIASWRNQGILTRHMSPVNGIFRGTTAIINLNGEDPDAMLVQGNITMAMSFQSLGFSTYPGSLMGVIAHIRQTLSDAVHYRDAWGIYRSNRRGIQRPETDRTLEALQPVINGQLPLLFPATRVREVRRSVAMCQQFGARCMIAGGYEADEVAPLLKESNTPVLVSLNFPHKPRDMNPEAEEDTSVIRYRVNATIVASKLQQEGVKFAFASDGASGEDFLAGLRKVTERGLAKDATIRAATLGAAEILGISDVLGSVERGKIANLVVSDKELLEEDASVKHTFVDGRHFKAPDRPARGSGRGGRGRRGGNPGGLSADHSQQRAPGVENRGRTGL